MAFRARIGRQDDVAGRRWATKGGNKERGEKKKKRESGRKEAMVVT